MNEVSIKEAIKQRDFSRVEEYIQTHTDSFKSLKKYEKESLINGALRHKAFPKTHRCTMPLQTEAKTL